jgi:uridine kinase
LTVFVDVPESVCFQRRIKRDVSQRGRTRESVIDQYEKTVRPMFNEFVEPSKQFAQLVIENGNDQNNAQTELMRAVRDLLV